jgi:hypothetical protein
VRGGCLVVVNLKFPLSSVKVPLPEPFTVIDTADTDSFETLFLTLPLIVTCGKQEIEKTFAKKNVARQHRLIRMINRFGLLI